MYVSLCVGVHSMKEKGFHASLIVSGHRMGSPSLLLIVMATSLCMGWGPASLMNRYLIHSLNHPLTHSLTYSFIPSLTHLLIHSPTHSPTHSHSLPDEQFFHTDYRPLMQDRNHFVVEKSHSSAPQLLPPTVASLGAHRSMTVPSCHCRCGQGSDSPVDPR